MNAPEAREIRRITIEDRPDLSISDIHRMKHEANGYLACLEGPEVQALMSSMDDLLHDGHVYGDGSSHKANFNLAKERLTAFRKAVGK